MPYPFSPFHEDFDISLIDKVENESTYSSPNDISKLKGILQWLCTTPKITSLRVNTLRSDIENIMILIDKHFKSISNNLIPFTIYVHEDMKDVIIIEHSPKKIENIHLKEVIVDTECGAAVLRGAHIFAPGVLGMVNGCQKGDWVSIYVDLAKQCKQGLPRVYTEAKIFIGNGIVTMTRSELYGANLNPRGIAIQVTETISGCIQISEEIFPPGSTLLQNVPSTICVYLLDPQPNEIILDMCAAPGNKTSHIAALMKNQGILVAIDKTPKKIKLLREHCSNFNVNAHIFLGDSTTIFQKSSKNKPEDGPPFPPESFDKILLDAPCSALGKRPQFRNDITNKVLSSYVPLQKKLFSTAVNLLKNNGILVYSTCTITIGENEGVVAWALRKFSNLKLVQTKLQFGSPGLDGTSMTKDELCLLQRFGENSKTDSIGFFIACFIKNC